MNTLICIDFINDIIHPDGTLAKKRGYATFAHAHGVLDRVAVAQAAFRARQCPVVHVRVGFSRGYRDWPADSPLFGKAKDLGVLELGTWGTEFIDRVKPLDDEPSIAKPRVSAFYGTRLASLLASLSATRVYIAGVSTDLAVEAAARDAHDRDLHVTVLGDCCAAGTESDHAAALHVLGKIARVATSDDIEQWLTNGG